MALGGFFSRKSTFVAADKTCCHPGCTSSFLEVTGQLCWVEIRSRDELGNKRDPFLSKLPCTSSEAASICSQVGGIPGTVDTHIYDFGLQNPAWRKVAPTKEAKRGPFCGLIKRSDDSLHVVIAAGDCPEIHEDYSELAARRFNPRFCRSTWRPDSEFVHLLRGGRRVGRRA